MFKDALSQKAQTILSNLSASLMEWNFYLAGGSGLALQIGHRLSEDLGFFSLTIFNTQNVVQFLRSETVDLHFILEEQNTLIVEYEDVYLSFIHYTVPLIYPLAMIMETPVADWRDIAAEKFKTLSQRGSKKDFYDLHEIFAFGHLTIQEGTSLFRKRFENTGINLYHVLRSLTFFEDAEADPDPRLLLHHHGWEDVKIYFKEHIHDFEKYLFET